MAEWLKNYRTSIILLSAIIIGGIAGIVFGEDATVVKPLGDLFLNLIFMIIIPLVFFSVSSAIANTGELKRLGKILVAILLVFFVTALISAVLGYIGVRIYNPLKGVDTSSIMEIMTPPEEGEITEDFWIISSTPLPFLIFLSCFQKAICCN